jgi:pyruvate dehydrogenase E2 component (dihydrolipoamide acetyltransferase)
MPTSVVMPALEMAQETGKVISWLKNEGEAVAKGEPLLEIETDKAVMEIESPADGVLAGVKAEPGAEIQVGRTIAWIVKPGEMVPAEEAAASESESGRKVVATSGTSPLKPKEGLNGAPSGTREIKISPKARRLAKEKGVDVAQLRGSGPGREILAADVEAAAESSQVGGHKPAANMGHPSAVGIGSSGDRVIRSSGDFGAHSLAGGGARATHSMSTAQTVALHGFSSIARLMAERTTNSWTTVPHFFVTREVEATALNEAKQALAPQVEKSHTVRLTHSDLLVALVARVLAKHPRLNASWAGDSIRENSDVNISLAMAVGDGVVAPVIARADKLELGAIAVQRRDLAERARSNRLRPADLAGGTFTISNLGMYEVDEFTAIITPPQSAVLAVGRIIDRVVAMAGQAVVRPMIALTLSVDHRVADGVRAAEFMRDLAGAIGNPAKNLMIESLGH